MATFAFKALDLAGMPSKGEMDAGDKQAVAAQLRGKGLIVIDIEEQTPASAGDLMARFKRVKADELVIATRQLATMVNSGMSLLRSLYVIEEQTENDQLREIFVDVRKDVEAGLSLSDALRKHPDMFNALYVAMVQAGETGGILDEHAAPRCGPAREGRLASPPDQGGDDVPARSSADSPSWCCSRSWRSSCRCSRRSSRTSAASCRRSQSSRSSSHTCSSSAGT